MTCWSALRFEVLTFLSLDTSHLKLHHASLPEDAVEHGACIVHSEPKHCLDVALHRESGTAYLVCDEDAGTGRWDPLRGHWGEQTRAKIWSWKIDEVSCTDTLRSFAPD